MAYRYPNQPPTGYRQEGQQHQPHYQMPPGPYAPGQRQGYPQGVNAPGNPALQQYPRYPQTHAGGGSNQYSASNVPRLPSAYPSYGSPPSMGQPASNQTYFHSSASPVAPAHQTYNPGSYDYVSPPSSPPLRQNFAPPPPPKPYNPAQYPSDSIANAVDKMWGPSGGNSYSQPPTTAHQHYNSYPSQAPEASSTPAYGPGPRPMHQTSINRHQQSPASTQPPAQAFPEYQQYHAPPQPPALPPRGMSNSSAQSGYRPLLSTAQMYSSVGNNMQQQSATMSPSTPTRRPYSFQLPPNPYGVSSSGTQELIEDEPNWGYADQHQTRPVDRRPSEPRSTGLRQKSRSDDLSNQLYSRPLPGLPVEIEPDVEPTHFGASEDVVQEDLYDDIEDSLNSYGSRLSANITPSMLDRHDSARSNAGLSPSAGHSRAPSNKSDRSARSDMRYSKVSGGSSPSRRYGYGDYSDDSDAEAAAGLAAMAQAAEAERASELRRSFGAGDQPQYGHGYPQASGRESMMYEDEIEDEDEEDYPPIEDMSLMAGGPDISMTYRDDPLLIAKVNNAPEGVQGQHPSNSSRGTGYGSKDGYVGRVSSQTSLTDMSTYEDGTGGFVDPREQLRRLSFDADDEEEEALSGTVGEPSPGKPRAPTSNLENRPLPPPPLEEETPDATTQQMWQQGQYPGIPSDPSAYERFGPAPVPGVKQSHSVQCYPSTPRTPEPARSITDPRRDKRLPRLTTTEIAKVAPQAELQTPAVLDLPVLPREGFHPASLTQKHFDRCSEPWALSDLGAWLRALAGGETELKEAAIEEALIALFTHKVAEMHITLAESLAETTLREMYLAKVLEHDEEWLRFGDGAASGVLYQLTVGGCYAPSVHSYAGTGRCYAPHCQQTVRKLELQRQPTRAGTTDWASYHNLTKDDISKAGKQDIELQNNLHEVVATEDGYMDQLEVLSTLYRDALKIANPPIVSPRNLPDFIQGVFGKLDAVKACNEEHLLPQLKYRQQEQGPWIKGFSDIFRNWIRKAKTPYIDYAANFPYANFLMKQEESRNRMFVTFVDAARNNQLSKRLDWASYLRAPISRLQRYGLLLSTVLKHMPPEQVDEVSNLTKALAEIKEVTMACDSRVAEMGKKADMHELQNRLELPPEMRFIELNLTHPGRELLHNGSLQRYGKNKISLVQANVILLDNYFVLAKNKKDGSNRLTVSKPPIPMDLLILESRDDDLVETSLRGGTKPHVPTRPGPISSHSRAGRANSTAGGVPLSVVTSTDSTAGKVGPSANLEGSTNEKVLYPFRVKHLGREVYQLFASSLREREQWCDKIVEAKTKHASAQFTQNAEPFSIRVLADSAFAYEGATSGGRAMLIKGTPLQRAIADVDQMYAQTARPSPVCRARVNCATSFRPPSGRQMLAVGTDYGAYIAEAKEVRTWTKVIGGWHITQLCILEDFNLLLLIANKALLAYHLDTLVSADGTIHPTTSSNTNTRKAPQKLSGSKEVSFFNTGRLKDRILIFYKTASGIGNTSTFKIIEPVLHRVADKSRTRPTSGFNRGGGGHLETFRDYDDFAIPIESVGLDIFNNTISVATIKGFEVLNLDKKTPFSVPDLKGRDVATIARRLETAGTPRHMFRLGAAEFLCVYEECAVYVNQFSDINRSVVMEFVGRARSACLVHGKGAERFLILFDDDFVEVRDAHTGRLKQIIPGRDVRCLDDGLGITGQQTVGSGMPQSAGGFSAGGYSAGGHSAGGFGGGLGVNGFSASSTSGTSGTVKFALQHPDMERCQLLVELVLDEARF